MFNKSILPLVSVFLAFGAAVLIFRNYLQQNGIDWQVISGGNLVIYVITIVSLHMLNKSLDAGNTQVFLRNALGGIFLKLMACAAAAFIYIFIARTNVNKPSIFILMALYLLYTFVEMKIVLKHSKQKKNG